MKALQRWFWVLLHHGGGRGAMFVFFALLPLVLAPDVVDGFAYWYAALMLIFQPWLDSAPALLVTKSVALGAVSTVAEVIRIWHRVVPPVMVVATVVLYLAGAPMRIVSPLMLMLLFLFWQNLVFALYRGAEEFRLEGIAGGLSKLLAPALLVVAATAWRDRLLLASVPSLALLASTAFAVAICAAWAWPTLRFLLSGSSPDGRALDRVLADLRPSPDDGAIDRVPISSVLRQTLVFGLVLVTNSVYLRLDVVMLGWLGNAEQVGDYFVASRWLEAFFVVPQVALWVYLPAVARGDRPAVFVRLLAFLGAGGVLAAVACSLLARFALIHLYSDSPQIPELLRVLAPTTVAVYLAYLFTQWLMVRERERYGLLVAVLGLAVNFGLNLLLIERYGATGAAWATVATEASVALLAAFLVLVLSRDGSLAGREPEG